MSSSEEEKDYQKIVKEIARLKDSQELDFNRVIDAIHQLRKSQERFSWLIVILTIINVGLVYTTLLFIEGYPGVIIAISVAVWLIILTIVIFLFYKYLEKVDKEEENSRKAPILMK